ncbi:MAG: NAD-dependent epimerase/dehydratase family protein, partial [Rhodospirillales bacterium]
MQRVLITGAAGALGKVLREKLAGAYPILRLSYVMDMGKAGKGEEVVRCELGDAAAVDELC